jgi:hypothetical protein
MTDTTFEIPHILALCTETAIFFMKSNTCETKPFRL